MRKEDKSVIIAQLGEMLTQYPHFYLVDVEGMDAAATSALRRKCFQTNLKMVVVKNTLLQKALDASEIDFEPLYGCLKGTTAILFTEVANAPAKMLKDLASKKITKPELKAAYAEEGIYVGANQLDVSQPVLYADLKSHLSPFLPAKPTVPTKRYTHGNLLF